jgi:SAM-dependent methyltransferase
VSSPASGLTAERFAFLTDAIWAVEALAAASKLAVLDRLASAPATADEVAADCGLNVNRIRLLLSALAGLGVIQPTGVDQYRVALPGLTRLVPRLLPDGRLAGALRGDVPDHRADTVGGSQEIYPDMVSILAGVFRAAAERAADLLAADGLRVLDVGAGAAPWSLAIAARYPNTEVVAVDLPDVIPATRAAVAEAGVDDRYRFLAGDIFEVDLEENAFDLVIVGGFCHIFDEEMNLRLLRRLAAALRSEGTLAIAEPLPNESLDGPLSVILYALGLTTRTASGGVYPFSTYVRWLHEAGLRDIERHDLSDVPPVSLITAHRTKKGLMPRADRSVAEGK